MCILQGKFNSIIFFGILALLNLEFLLMLQTKEKMYIFVGSFELMTFCELYALYQI